MAIQSHLEFGIDYLRLSSAAEVDSILENWGIDLLKTAELLNSDFHLKWDDNDYIISRNAYKHLEEYMSEHQVLIANEIITQPITSFNYDLIKTLNRMVEYEVPCGLVTPDDRQIWVNRQSEHLFHASGQELVQVKTSDFWHPADLADFHQKIRQTSKNSSFEYTYRARMGFKKNEDGSDIWMQLTNVYEIIDDSGNRLARNLGSREIASPVVQ